MYATGNVLLAICDVSEVGGGFHVAICRLLVEAVVSCVAVAVFAGSVHGTPAVLDSAEPRLFLNELREQVDSQAPCRSFLFRGLHRPLRYLF